MTLVHNWTGVPRRSWTVRLLILASLLSCAEVAVVVSAPDCGKAALAVQTALR